MHFNYAVLFLALENRKTGCQRENYLKRFKINYLLAALVAVPLTLALWPTLPWHKETTDHLTQIKSRGVLRLSTLNSPLSYYTINQSPAGMDYELAKRFAGHLGVHLQVTVRKTLNDLFDDLENGRADVLGAGLSYSTEYLEKFRYGPSWYSASQQLVYRIGQPRPKSLGHLKGQLSVASGSAYLPALREAKQRQYPGLNWTLTTDQSPKELLQAVADGRLDYTIGDSVTIALLQRICPQLAVAFDVAEENPLLWYIPRSADDSFDAAMLDFFSQMNQEGNMTRLEEKYMGHVGTFDYVDTRSFLRAVDTLLPTLKPLFQRYACDIDWRLLAALSYQESHWNPLATSVTGVRGLMMLTRNTAASLNVTNRLDPEQSIRGGSEYLQRMIEKIPSSVPEEERIWFALAAYNIGYAHILDARRLTQKQKSNPDSWAHVKLRLPMLSQKPYYSQTYYGYARGKEAYTFVENIRKYQISLVGYLLQQERKRSLHEALEAELVTVYPTVAPENAVH